MMTSFEDFTDSGSVALLESIKQEQRDLPAISAQVRGLAAALSSAPAPSFARLQGDWKLAFVSSEQGFSLIGTGLHKVFGTRMEELFVTFSGRRKARLIETTEVLRVIGPFPNVKNVLSGTIAFKEAGGGAAAIAAETGASLLTLTYSSMIEGTGRVSESRPSRRRNRRRRAINDGGPSGSHAAPAWPEFDMQRSRSASRALVRCRPAAA